MRVDNDVKATALGAADYLRAGDGDLTYINFGTGVSAATIAAGTLVRGAGNLAGEIGHLAVDPTAEQCACGQRGLYRGASGGGRIAQRLAVLGPPVSLANLIEIAAPATRTPSARRVESPGVSRPRSSWRCSPMTPVGWFSAAE